jgi:hypothetical protein
LAVFGGCLILAHDEARAAPAPPQLDLVYEAPPECPSRDELEQQLRARVPPSWLAGADTRRFEVRIVRDERGYAGRLDVTGRGREPSVREIRAGSCRAVGTSLTVFLAIALDPTNEDEEADATAVEESSPSSTVPRPSRRSSRQSARPAPTAHWMWSAGFDATHLRAPQPGWGGRVHAELVRVPGRGVVAPAARFSWGWSDFSLFPSRAGEASFRLRSARAEGCARFDAAPLALSTCLALDVGELSATAPELPRGGHASSPWAAGGLVVRASWSLAPWLAIEADLGLIAPFRRTSFVLTEPFRSVYRPPVILVEGTAGACISARFH